MSKCTDVDQSQIHTVEGKIYTPEIEKDKNKS